MSLHFASELISASLVNRITDNPVVHEAASFILKNSSESTQSQQKIAKEVLLGTNNAEANHVSGLTNITINELGACLQEKVFREKIHNLKQYVINFPYNVIAWVELSRCYSILGQEEQALRSMKVFLSFSDFDRNADGIKARRHTDRNAAREQDYVGYYVLIAYYNE